MADQYTGADAIRVFLTGAASDGGAQSDPAASLGKYRSSTRLDSLGVSVVSGPANITVEFASAENGPGEGEMDTKSVNSLSWTAPGDTEGAEVTIANGETKLLPSNDPNKFLIVTRTSAADLANTATITLTDVMNNLWDNVSDAERTAGDVEIRCVCFKNVSSSEIKSLKAWLGTIGTAAAVDASGYAASGAVTVTSKVAAGFADWDDAGFVHNDDTNEVMYFTKTDSSNLAVAAGGRDVWGDGAAAGLEDHVIRQVPQWRIGKEAPSGQPNGSFTDASAGEGEASPVTCYHPVSAGDAAVVNIGDLAAGYIYALWVERKIVAGAAADPSVLDVFQFSFESA
ncbi:MAG TPA: hypothetical protein PLE19_12745 [Planctomycetota bacterium]|nr:hypothetical protein [Planctomycetota bacterium]HRT95759.1 hypothetical protein [Planctomycetota bacterium]